MVPQREAGRRLVLAVIVASLALEVLTIALFNLQLGPARLPQQIIRFLLTIGLCIFLYRGANWARWLAGVLFALVGPISLVLGLGTLPMTSGSLLLIVIGTVYMACAVILLFVPRVRMYYGAGNAG
jgi:hypothetical protein